MFSLRMLDAKILKDVFVAISTLIDEATFSISSEGISLRSMDPSRVAMIDFSMHKSAFEDYNIKEDTKVCLRTNELLKLLKRAGREESLDLMLDENTGEIMITIQGKYTRTFRMPTLDITEEEVPIPKISFKAKVTLTTDGLRQALEDAILVSDHISIDAESNRLLMNAKGDLMGANIKLEKESDALLDIAVKEPSKSMFSLSYLSDIVKAASATSDIVTLEFSTDMPIRLDFKQRYEGKLSYYLAPRMEIK